jgi:hypothetical protein
MPYLENFLRTVFPTLFFCVYLAIPVSASTIRLAALGGETRFLRDTSNIYIYPAHAGELPHFGVDFFDDWGGVVYPLKKGHALGLFFNRPTAQLNHLNTYLSQNGSTAFNNLQARPWADVLYGLRLRKNLQIGLLGRFAYDTRERELMEASASSADLRLGIHLGNLDATVGLLRRRFRDVPSDAVAPFEQTDGGGYLLDLRVRMRLAPQLDFYPSAGIESSSFALSPARRDYQALHLGLGLNFTAANHTLIVAGLLARYQRAKLHAPNTPELDEATLVLPATIIAGETQVGSILFRLGLRHESILTSQEQLQNGRVVSQRDFQTPLQTNLGIGLEFGPLLLDGLLERDFLRDGPHLIGGSRHGGGIFSKLSLTYHFED